MDPISRKQFSGRAFTLGYFIFVMRELQVLSPAMYIERFAEVFHRHRGALDVPSRTSASERSIPTRLFAFTDQFPERKITCIFLIIFVGINPLAAPRDIAGKIDL